MRRLQAYVRGKGITDASFCLDLSAPVDVYSDWIDACDNVAKEAGSEEPEAAAARRIDSEEAGAIVEDGEEEDADAGYGEEVAA